jgi:membrane protease YdiL (CAAX protease family)
MGLGIIQKTKGVWINTSNSTLLYLLLVVILGGLISSYLLGAIICKLVYGISFFSSSHQVFDPSNLELMNAMKTMQLFNAIGTFVLPPMVFLHFRGLSFVNYLKLENPLSGLTIAKVFVLALAMIPLANYLGSLNEIIPFPEFLNFLKVAEEQTLLLTQQFLIMDSIWDLGIMIFIIGVVAALGEELLFRGILQNLFQDWSQSKHLAVWFTALLFSVIHMQYHAVLPRFFLGAFIGYVYVYSGSLRSAIYLHFFYNTSLVVLSYLIQHEFVAESWEFIGNTSISVIIAVTLLFSLSYKWFSNRTEYLN